MAEYGAIRDNAGYEDLPAHHVQGGRAWRFGAKRPVHRRRVRYACYALMCCACIAWVALVIGLPILVTVIKLLLFTQFQERWYAPEETQLISVPSFFCQGVSLSEANNTDVTIYLVPEPPPLSTYKPLQLHKTERKLRYAWFQTYLHLNSTISISACVPSGSFFYQVYIFRSLQNIGNFLKDPNSVRNYYLTTKDVTQSCESDVQDNGVIIAYNASVGDNYAVGFIPTQLEFSLNATVLFNRTEYSIDQLNGSFPNCTIHSSLSSCDLGVPLGSTTNALVVAAEPPDWDNHYYTQVTVGCDSRALSYVIITVPPVTVFLAMFIAGALGSAFTSKCGRNKYNGEDAPRHIPRVFPEGIQPFVPHENE